MRTLVWVLIFVAIVGGFVAHRRSTSDVASQSATATQTAALPVAPREVSEHNWARHSLDRAADVKRQVVEGRKADEVP